jgi:Arc/MetJ-type ribon-helix-helix transcriptional regulator
MGRRVQAKDRVTIKIPRELYDKVAERIEETGFRSVSEFVIHVIRDITASGKLTPAESPDSLNQEEIQMVRERLKTLGYIE